MQKVKFQSLENVTEESKAQARRSMTGSELRLYLYLMDMAQQSPAGWFPLDRWDVVEYYGVGIASYQRALTGLKEKGYLRKRGNSGTFYFDAVGGFKS